LKDHFGLPLDTKKIFLPIEEMNKIMDSLLRFENIDPFPEKYKPPNKLTINSQAAIPSKNFFSVFLPRSNAGSKNGIFSYGNNYFYIILRHFYAIY
jgi:hypothetical protein